jgi:hypothetical protein
VQKTETGIKFFGNQKLSVRVSPEIAGYRAATLLSLHRTGPDTAIALWEVRRNRQAFSRTAFVSRSSGGPTMVVFQHSTKSFTTVDSPVL